ncbi:N-acetylmuramoyl-L-alanine amidase [Nitratifractor salsuginis]|uniref:N-acetylmuramoyl-L-alanine amidase n=1 Tax=Nitratifractor salsuginis (strain DSM 16511 / JCM 12458 / E9I37-1) TaxID=749222 RepID=E6X2Q9_NITSE|nr:N-acetylmuramoyl-L-alanine amidase [Nitratifractor salsuginis]ADV46125.1 cell wall hydrolase/autolysin [Nitratifractor salsuginis DSM 16511]
MASRFALLFTLLFSSILFASPAKLKSLEMGVNRLILHFDRTFPKENVHSFILKGKDSFRYVFDLKNTRLAGKKLTSKLHYGPSIRSIRIAQYRSNIVRLVVETPEPYAVAHYPLQSRSYIIVLPKGSSDFSTQIRGLFSGLQSKTGRKKAPLSHKAASRKKTSKSRSDAYRAASGSHMMKNPPPKAHRRYTVIVDPGHGGHDTGALDPTHRYREKDAVLQIALRLRNHLRKMGFNVVMTRSSDRFIKLRRRTHFANLKHGDVFVSIHANAVGRLSRAATAHGIETYFLSPARSERARRVAAKENSIAFIRRDSKTMNSFISTLTRSKIILSNMLALDVQRSILGTLRRRYRNVTDGGVRAAPFWVLVGAEMPAILVETGYITNPWEKKRLFNPRYQDMEAQGIAKGIVRFLRNREREME